MPEDRHEQAPRARAFWSGTITFGLVNIPVDLFAAVRGRQTAMKMVDAQGEPLGRRYVCPKDDQTLAAEDIVRGYETDDGKMVVVTDEELESVAPEMTRDIELRRFVPLAQIPPVYFDRPYFLAPAGRSTRAYRLLAETMQRSGRVGIGTFVMRGHQHLVAILSDGALLRAETLRFADELRSPADVGLPERSKPAAKTVKALAAAIEELRRDALDMDEMADRYAEEIRSLAQAKASKREDVIDQAAPAEEEDEEAAAGNVIDLMQVLRERLATRGASRPAAAKGREATPAPERRAKKAAAKGRTKTSGAGKRASKEDEKGKTRSPKSASLNALSKDDLYERAQALDIPGRSKMGKKTLIEAIRRAS